MAEVENALVPELVADRKPRGLDEAIAVAEERFRKIEAHRLSQKRLMQTAMGLIKQNQGAVDTVIFPEPSRTDAGEGYLKARLKLNEELAIAIGFHGIGVIRQEGGLAALTGARIRREILSRDQLTRMERQRNDQGGIDLLGKILFQEKEKKAGDIRFDRKTLVISDKRGNIVIRLIAFDDFPDDGENFLELCPPDKASERFSFENLGLDIEDRTTIYNDLTTKLVDFLRPESNIAV